jgi:hypothetical protein
MNSLWIHVQIRKNPSNPTPRDTQFCILSNVINMTLYTFLINTVQQIP